MLKNIESFICSLLDLFLKVPITYYLEKLGFKNKKFREVFQKNKDMILSDLQEKRFEVFDI